MPLEQFHLAQQTSDWPNRMLSLRNTIDLDPRAFRYPPAPGGMLVYAIGDIHGRSDLLREAQRLIDRDRARRGGKDTAVEVYIGDYVDRGPDSKGVLDLLIARSASASIITLRGNHEIAMESFLRGLLPFEDWRALGGLETVLSYGVDARGLLAQGGVGRRDLAMKMPVAHFRFLASLNVAYRLGQYCFVHAGLRPGVAIEQQSTNDLVSIRDEFLNFSGDFGAIVVHGHNPVEDVDFRPNRINIDTGAYATSRLSVTRIDAGGVSLLNPTPR
jgi:serine/threonine protein phosphatase 1